MASGVTSSVTHGIATALASSPTSETWLNSSSDSGVSASVTTHCSRTARRSPPPELASSAGQNPGLSAFFKLKVPVAPVAWARVAPESVANNTPTATNDSQNPACIKAHGSSATTTAMASSQVCNQGHCRPLWRSSTTVASIQMVRCAGTPQPENRA